MTPAQDGPDCRCGHTASVHDHYRAGTDCPLCDCPAYWPFARRVITWWLRKLR